MNEQMRRYLNEIDDLMMIPEAETVGGAFNRLSKSVIRLRVLVEMIIESIDQGTP